MSSMLKSLLALTSLVAAFYLSISYQYGDPGWQLEFKAREAVATPERRGDYDLKQLAILNRAVIHIKENYVDPSRINERKMLGAAMEEVQRAVAELLVEVERDSEKVPTRLTVRVDEAEATFDLKDVGNLWQMTFKFKDIFKFIQANLRRHEKLRDIEYAAINGMLNTLDPHSVLLRPEDHREMKLSTRGKFGGLGIVISVRDGQLTIINPIEDTPASRAGLKAGDRIVQIELDSTVNMALSDAVDMLRGEPNTKVNIWVLREGWKKPKRFTLARANIKVKSVAHRLLPGKVGLVRLRNFQNTTYDELRGAIDRMRRKARGKLQGLVIDLRGNPGGLLDQAIKVSDLFIESGPVVTTVGFGDKMREPKMATRSDTERKYPLVVLIDPSSASASEIVAGALKNHKRALVIGQQSFGKGSVQVIYDNKDDSALKLTIAQYLTPGDLSIQSVGIAPDILTEAAVLEKEQTAVFSSRGGRGGEKDLPAHLEHASSKVSQQQKPEYSVRYLQDQKLRKKIEENPNDLIVDFEIGLARDLIAASQSGSRDEMLNEARAALDARIAKEEGRIIAALAGRGVDWSPNKFEGGTPQAEVTLTTDRANNAVVAGETLEVEATVRNLGDAPFVQLRASSESENRLLGGHEFLFGNIPPGETRTWKVKVEVPKRALSRRDEMKLKFSEARSVVPPEAGVKVDVQQLPRPRFAMTWRVDDREKGNGDGLLQVGEESQLVLEVENVGEGKAHGLVGALRNDSADVARSIFIKRGRIRGEALPPGARSEIRFSFKVKDAVEAATVPVDISVIDPDIGESTSQRISLRVVPRSQSLQASKTRLQPKEGEQVLLMGMYESGSAAVVSAQGSVMADGRFGEWYRVSTGDGLYGWVRENQVDAKPGASGGELSKVMAAGPPAIVLTDKLRKETRDDALVLNGEVTGARPIRDLLVYVNARKVYFRSNNGGVPLRFSARVPLEKGVNRITVIARENEEAASRRTVIVTREVPGTDEMHGATSK